MSGTCRQPARPARRASSKAITAEHESPPALVDFHILLRHGDNATFLSRRETKAPPFTRMVANLSAGGILADINHMYVKSWWDIVDDWLSTVDPDGARFTVDVIVLRRWLPHVLRSMLVDRHAWLPQTPPWGYAGGEYTVFHPAVCTLPPLTAFGSLDSLDLAVGYNADMELRYTRYLNTHKAPRFRVTHWRSEELFTMDGIRRLLETLDLGPPVDRRMVELAYTKPVNQHVSWKGPEMLEVPAEAFHARVQRMAAAYDAAGVGFPRMPHLSPAAPCANATAIGRWLAAADASRRSAFDPPTPPHTDGDLLWLDPHASAAGVPLAAHDPRRERANLWCSWPAPVMSEAQVNAWSALELPNNFPPVRDARGSPLPSPAARAA